MGWVRNTGLLLILLSLLPVQAARNKWVDDEGQIHYGDRVPSQYLSKDREEISDHGVIVKKYEKLKTQEQLNEEEEKKRLEAKALKLKLIENRKKALRDRVLTDTFTTERDILMARDRRIDAVTSQINLTVAIIKDDEKKITALKERIAKIEKSGRKVPENTSKSLLVMSNQLENHYKFVEEKSIVRQNILNDFDRDIKRFRELKGIKKKNQADAEVAKE